MYTDNKTVLILISLLKEYGVRHLVLSAGTRNVPFVHSVETDDYFTCYSIVDERSAGYFALGIALETGEPVLMSCTSSTASTNYTSAMWEASRQKLPLIALTADRNQYYIGQLEDQMIEQAGMYRNACRKSVNLPIVKDDKDAWYCYRVINEALLELNHHSGGPVHINMPIEWGLFAQNFNVEQLPKIKKINRYDYQSMKADNNELFNEFKQKKRVLIIYGQSRKIKDKDKVILEKFAKKYNCFFAVENISNFSCFKSLNTSLISRILNKETVASLLPDLVISVEGDYVSTIKGLLKGCKEDFEHWTVNRDGIVVDQFKRLTKVFECSTREFFSFFSEFDLEDVSDNEEYFHLWSDYIAKLPFPDFPYSSNYLMQEFSKLIPENSILHLGNGVAVHIAQYFNFSESITSYCHTGTTTIDGSLSAFVGQAALTTKLCFIFIGDLSFFYDMNALWNRYVGKNVRILLYNNEGGETFHWNAAKDIETLGTHISAEHFTSAKGWAESQGLKYLAVRDKSEYDKSLSEFINEDSETPILLEAFTKKEEDSRILLDFYEQCRRALNV